MTVFFCLGKKTNVCCLSRLVERDSFWPWLPSWFFFFVKYLKLLRQHPLVLGEACLFIPWIPWCHNYLFQHYNTSFEKVKRKKKTHNIYDHVNTCRQMQSSTMTYSIQLWSIIASGSGCLPWLLVNTQCFTAVHYQLTSSGSLHQHTSCSIF